MARSLRIEYPGARYHVSSRGNERRGIFKDDSDRARFLEILASTSNLQQSRKRLAAKMEGDAELGESFDSLIV